MYIIFYILYPIGMAIYACSMEIFREKPKIFTANHPFIYILKTQQECILFKGHARNI